MKIISNKITRSELKQAAEARFGDMIKAVVDVSKRSIALDAELHADLEALLLESGSQQKDLWGINLYPDLAEDDFVEFDSLMNVKPSEGNRSRGVEDESIRLNILSIVKERVV